MIALDPELCPRDLKSLRLTCRVFEHTTKRALFRRVILSRLHEDRQAFEKYASDPSLARCVEEIVWEDLDLHIPGPEKGSVYRHYDPEDKYFKGNFTVSRDEERDRALFWVPETHMETSRTRWELLGPTLPGAFPWLFAAVKNMPRLSALTVSSMRYDRAIWYNGKQFLTCLYKRAPYELENGHHRSLGLVVVSALIRELGRQVQALKFRGGTWSVLDTIDMRTTRYLETIDLGEYAHIYDLPNSSQLFSNFQSLANLRSLRLGIMQTYVYERRCNDYLEALVTAPHWPRLQSFHLWSGGYDCEEDDTIDRTEVIVRAIANLGPQLLELTLLECCVTGPVLCRLRERQALPRLQSFRILAHACGSHKTIQLPEATVLAFLRNEIADLSTIQPCLSEVDYRIWTQEVRYSRIW